MGCTAGWEAAGERVAQLAQGHGALRQCAASEADRAAARAFAAEGGAAGGLGPGDCTRTLRRNVFRRARERSGKRRGAGMGHGVVLDAGDRTNRDVCVYTCGQPNAAAVLGGQGQCADKFAALAANGDRDERGLSVSETGTYVRGQCCDAVDAEALAV